MDDKSLLPNLSRDNLADEAYRVLRDRICRRQFEAGDRLDLPSIEDQLGISRTPLKAALDRLALDGLVEIVPRRGTYVTTPDPEAMENAFSVREILEVYAVTRSVELMTEAQLDRLEQILEDILRITKVEDQALDYLSHAELDDSFHSLIVEAAGNDILTRLWDQVHVHVQMARITYTLGDFKSLARSAQEHAAILDALRRRDSKAAEVRVRDHLRRAGASLRAELARLRDV